jgi:uncharacterized protein (TIGR00730 family)
LTYQLRRVCVFFGSSAGNSREYQDAALQLGTELAARRIGLVFGGGCVGLMGIIADTILDAGGHAIGVIPHALVAREVAHKGLPDLRVVHSMHERKAMMAELSDAFIAMPGGFGTFEELCEVVTWTQLGLHRKRCGLLNVSGYYDALLSLIDHSIVEGFVKPSNRDLVVSSADPAALLDLVAAPLESSEPKWIRSTDET